MARDITKLHPEARRLALLLVDECEREGLVIKKGKKVFHRAYLAS